MSRKNIAVVFGSVLRKYRRKSQLTQEQLAFEANLDRNFISLLELGKRMPSLDTVLAISRALRLPLAVLMASVEAGLEESIDNTDPTSRSS